MKTRKWATATVAPNELELTEVDSRQTDDDTTNGASQNEDKLKTSNPNDTRRQEDCCCTELDVSIGTAWARLSVFFVS